MSTQEELETELTNLRKIINERIEQANNSKLPEKIQEVAKTFGEHSKWGGGTYYYHGKGFHIEYCFHDNYLKVTVVGDKEAFSGELQQNGVADIFLYIPGDWEKELEKVHNKIPQVKETREIKRLQNAINELKEKWQIEV